MESNDQLKEINTKNRTSSYFDYIIKFEDFDLENILIDEKSYEKILSHNISDQTLIISKPLDIRFNKLDGVIEIRVYHKTKYLVLFGSEKYHLI